MKIIAVGRNYLEHARELNNAVPSNPVIFLKPDTALLRDNKPFYLPDFSNDIQHEVEIVLKIAKEGKCIQEKFASGYIQDISLGIDFTARDLQQQLKEKGLPWELSKAFDYSAVVGDFISVNHIDMKAINFSLKVNDVIRQQGCSSEMIFSFEKIISFVSSFITLRKGDLIFTGTPAGVAQVNKGDHLQGFIAEREMFNFHIR